MKIYWTSKEDEKKIRRELTKDEKDIGLTYGMIGFLLGVITIAVMEGLRVFLAQHLSWM